MQRFIVLACLLVFLARIGELSAQTRAEAEKYAKILKTDKDVDKRLRAAQELAEIATIKAVNVRPHAAILIEAFRSDKDPMVRAAAGKVLLVCEADPKEVGPAIFDVVNNEKEVGAVLAVGARLAGVYKVKEAIPALEALKKREADKEDPKLRDQRLVQALNQALQVLSK